MLYFFTMNSPIRALLFDFDGLILDTETPEVDVWTRIYAEYGFQYPQHLWSRNVGMWPHDSGFDPAHYLHELTQDSLDEEALRIRHRKESDEIIAVESVTQGVGEYLSDAKRLGMRLGIVSSSWRDWAGGHLTRLGLASEFDCIITSEYVGKGRTKPHPDLYQAALHVLGVRPAQAIAFEDSPHGLAAARAADIFAVAVPNRATAVLDLGDADLRIESLAAVPLEELLQRVNQRIGN